MGDHAEQLGRTRDANLGAMDTSVRQLSSYSSGMETTVDTLRAVGSEPGLEGAGADAATERFAALAREVATVADYLTTLAEGGAQATAAIVAAKQAYADLPDGELSWGERTGLTAATTVALPGFGTVTGVVAGEIISRQREAAREAAAAAALNRLDSSLSTISLEPPTTARSSADPTTGTTGAEGGGAGPRGTNVSGGWSGGSSGGTGRGVDSYSPGTSASAGLVGSSWTPGGNSVGGVPTGSGGHGGNDSGGGSVGKDPIFGGGGSTGGGSTGGGSGLGLPLRLVLRGGLLALLAGGLLVAQDLAQGVGLRAAGLELALELGVPLLERELGGGGLVGLGVHDRGDGRQVPHDGGDGDERQHDDGGRDAGAEGHPAHRGRPPVLAAGRDRCVRHRGGPPGRTGPRRSRRGSPRAG